MKSIDCIVLIFAVSACTTLTGCGDTRQVYPQGKPDLITHVAGVDGCLAFDFSVNNGVAVYGKSAIFTLKVTNTCPDPWKFTGGCYPLKVKIVNHGEALDEGEGDTGEPNYYYLPAGDCGMVVEYSVAQGDTISKDVWWDPEYANEWQDATAPIGFYDVHVTSYGKDVPFSGVLVVESSTSRVSSGTSVHME